MEMRCFRDIFENTRNDQRNIPEPFVQDDFLADGRFVSEDTPGETFADYRLVPCFEYFMFISVGQRDGKNIEEIGARVIKIGDHVRLALVDKQTGVTIGHFDDLLYFGQLVGRRDEFAVNASVDRLVVVLYGEAHDAPGVEVEPVVAQLFFDVAVGQQQGGKHNRESKQVDQPEGFILTKTTEYAHDGLRSYTFVFCKKT